MLFSLCTAADNDRSPNNTPANCELRSVIRVLWLTDRFPIEICTPWPKFSVNSGGVLQICWRQYKCEQCDWLRLLIIFALNIDESWRAFFYFRLACYWTGNCGTVITHIETCFTVIETCIRAVKNYLVRLGGAGAVLPLRLVGRLSCTKLPLLLLTAGPLLNVLSFVTGAGSEMIWHNVF